MIDRIVHRPMSALMVVSALLAAGCGHTMPTTSASAPATKTVGQTTPTTSAKAAAGTFGTLKGICGPGRSSGASSGAPSRGVTANDIQIGVLNDATSTLAPGLGAIYLDVAKAFSQWCNAAGGINGRKIKFVNRDAQIAQAAARITDACQSDFMLVGGATPFDANTVAPREQCKLGAIPAYAASTEATKGKLQALPTRLPAEEANLGLLRLLKGTYGSAFQKIGLLAVDTPSLLQPAEAAVAAAKAAGYRVPSFQKLPLSVDNWRTYVQPLVGTAEAVVPAPGDATGFFRAISDVGYNPKVVIDPVGDTYSMQTINSLKAASLKAPYYVSTGLYPLELADQNPAVKLAIDLTKATGTKNAIDAGITPSWESWVLFAKSASACGSDLTVSCVIGSATSDTKFTAGGLMAPVDLSNPTAIPPCIAILAVRSGGFQYERTLTKPTNGVFNCDPANVVKVKG